VDNAHVGFGYDGEIEIQQVVVVLVNGTGQGVFDRHYGGSGAAILKG
jgi:hypothetical protein